MERRIAAIEWDRIESDIAEVGHALAGPLLDADTCARLAAGYDDDALYRKRVDMDRHAFGSGEYAYFDEPLPAPVASLRERLYAGLAPIAARMAESLGRGERYPADLAAYRAVCARAGQTRPTPLVLRYTEGGYNRLHRDLYGDLIFPLQVTIMLGRPGRDFGGGEFLLVENRPRQQSIGAAVHLEQGQAVIFPVAERPVEGKRGMARAQVRHGVSRVTRGTRVTLGIIFHDAE